MSLLVKLRLIFGFAFLLFSNVILALEPNQSCQDQLEFYEDIRNQTILSFSLHEKTVIRSIKIKAIVAPSFSQAGAYIDPSNKDRYIVFSCTHMAQIGLAADAMAYLAILPEPDKTQANSAIEGYLRYIVHLVSFKKKVMNFPEFVGFSPPKGKQQYFDQVAFGFRYQMAASVLFHEFGHHVFPHLSTLAYDSAFSRSQEREADEWAVRAMLKNSMLPMLSSVLFKMLNELNRSDLKDEWKLRHPASLKRAVYYFEYGMAALDDPLIIRAYKETQHQTGVSLADAKAKWKLLLRNLKNILKDEQDRVDDPFLYWSSRAEESNTLGLIEMGYIYGGKYKEEKNLLKARKSFCRAAKLEDNDYSYDYVSKAWAHYLCGYTYGFWKDQGVEKNIEKAIYHLNKSSDMGLINAQVALRHLKE